MRVLISAGWLGGAGGAERALYSILRALSDDDVELVVRERLEGAWSVIPDGVRVSSPLDAQWWGAGHRSGVKGALLQHVANPVRRLVHKRFDAYIQFFAGATVFPAAHTQVRLLIPSGNVLTAEVATRFDAVAMQAPDNVRLVPSGAGAVLLPPPVYDLAPEAQVPDVALPERYLLTVFNPYDPIKGLADLRRAADAAPLPIVWCHSEATVRFEIPKDLREHPQICHVTDATPAQLRYLYENCAAYVSFSLTEGFGWSAADALRYSPAVATRPIGVFSNEAAWQPGVTLIGDKGIVDWERLLGDACAPATRDLAILEGSSFRDGLERVVRDHG